MACALTSGYTKPCRDGRGGIKSVYLSVLTGVSSYTETDGEITAIVNESNNQFWEWQLERDLSSANAVLTGSDENGTLYSAQTITMILNTNRKEDRNQIMLAAQNDLFAIVEYANGDFEGFGVDNGMSLTTSTNDSGVAKADRNGNTIVLNGMENEQPYKVDSTIIAALLIPVS